MKSGERVCWVECVNRMRVLPFAGMLFAALLRPNATLSMEKLLVVLWTSLPFPMNDTVGLG